MKLYWLLSQLVVFATIKWGAMSKNQESPILRLEGSWIYKTVVLADSISKKVDDVVHQVSGLNLSQWRVMAALADRPGRTARDVVDVTPMDKGIVSRAVRTLVEKEIVERKSSREDGRLSLLFLTSTGEALYREIVVAMDENGASGRHSVNKKAQEELIAALDTVINQYD